MKRLRYLDSRRLLPGIVIAAFMAVTIPHVATYAQRFEPADLWWVGWPYAIAVDCAIVVCTWFTRWKTTRVWAWFGYWAFVGASGAMNVAHVKPWQQPDAWAAWLYAAFPTGAIAISGFLYRQVDSLVAGGETRARNKAQAERDIAEPLRAERTVAAQGSQGVALTCWCGEQCGSQSALNAHTRRHVNEVNGAASPGEGLRVLQTLYPGRVEYPKHAQIQTWIRKRREGRHE